MPPLAPRFCCPCCAVAVPFPLGAVRCCGAALLRRRRSLRFVWSCPPPSLPRSLSVGRFLPPCPRPFVGLLGRSRPPGALPLPPPQPGAMCLGLVRPWARPARLRFRVGVCPVLSCCAEVPQKVESVLFEKLVCGIAVNVRIPYGIQTVTAEKR